MGAQCTGIGKSILQDNKGQRKHRGLDKGSSKKSVKARKISKTASLAIESQILRIWKLFFLIILHCSSISAKYSSEESFEPGNIQVVKIHLLPQVYDHDKE